MTAFLKAMVNRANQHRARIKKDVWDYDTVLALVDAAPIVLALWEDDAAPHGVGYLVVKATIAISNSTKGKIEAIPCADQEQAETLRRVVAALRPEIARGTT